MCDKEQTEATGRKSRRVDPLRSIGSVGEARDLGIPAGCLKVGPGSTEVLPLLTIPPIWIQLAGTLLYHQTLQCVRTTCWHHLARSFFALFRHLGCGCGPSRVPAFHETLCWVVDDLHACEWTTSITGLQVEVSGLLQDQV